MLTLTRFDHINMKVKDLAASKAFYRAVFGFEEKDGGVRRGTPWTVLGVSSRAYLALYEVKDGWAADESQSVGHFGIHVEDFAGAKDRLSELGIPIASEVDYGASRSLYIMDPSGHEIELSERVGGGL